MTTSPFPFVSISGAPRERGRQYSEAARERVRRSVGLSAGGARGRTTPW